MFPYNFLPVLHYFSENKFEVNDMLMYIETIGHEEESTFSYGGSNTQHKGAKFVADQFNILITDYNGKQIEKNKLRVKTLHKKNTNPYLRDTAYLLVDEIMSIVCRFKSLTVYCDREEPVNAYENVKKYAGVSDKWRGLKEEDILWDSMQSLKKNHVQLNIKYDVETVKNTFSNIIW